MHAERTATHPSELERDDAEVPVEAVLAQVQVVPPLVPLQNHHVVRVLVISFGNVFIRGMVGAVGLVESCGWVGLGWVVGWWVMGGYHTTSNETPTAPRPTTRPMYLGGLGRARDGGDAEAELV